MNMSQIVSSLLLTGPKDQDPRDWLPQRIANCENAIVVQNNLDCIERELRQHFNQELIKIQQHRQDAQNECQHYLKNNNTCVCCGFFHETHSPGYDG